MNRMRLLNSRFFLLSCLVPLLQAQGTDAEQFFESKVRPILANNCYTCHTGAQSGGLRLDSTGGHPQGRQATAQRLFPASRRRACSSRLTAKHILRLKMPPRRQAGRGRSRRPVQVGGRRGGLAGVGRSCRSRGRWLPDHAQQRAFWSFQPIKNPTPPPARLEPGSAMRSTHLSWRGSMRRNCARRPRHRSSR